MLCVIDPIIEKIKNECFSRTTDPLKKKMHTFFLIMVIVEKYYTMPFNNH